MTIEDPLIIVPNQIQNRENNISMIIGFKKKLALIISQFRTYSEFIYKLSAFSPIFYSIPNNVVCYAIIPCLVLVLKSTPRGSGRTSKSINNDCFGRWVGGGKNDYSDK